MAELDFRYPVLMRDPDLLGGDIDSSRAAGVTAAMKLPDQPALTAAEVDDQGRRRAVQMWMDFIARSNVSRSARSSAAPPCVLAYAE